MSLFYRHLSLALLSGALLFSTAAVAQNAARIGFVDTDRLLRESAPARAAQTKLEQEFLRREKEVDDLALALKNASEKFEREALTMGESTRQTRQRQLMDQDREFQRKRREFQEDLTARKQEELQLILDRANRVVREVAESEKFDAIFQEAVYINPKLDITDKVIQALEKAR